MSTENQVIDHVGKAEVLTKKAVDIFF